MRGIPTHVVIVLSALALGLGLAGPGGAAPVEDRPLIEKPARLSAQIPGRAAEPSVTILGSRQAQGVLGRDVRSSASENMGRIVDVIVDRTGRVRAAVIDFGGFLGVGSRKIAVDWNVLNFAAGNSKDDIVTLELTRDQVKAAPEYKDKQSVVVLGAAGGLQSLPAEW